jgi:hypothetical protein
MAARNINTAIRLALRIMMVIEGGGYASSELKALWCSKGRQLITR